MLVYSWPSTVCQCFAIIGPVLAPKYFYCCLYCSSRYISFLDWKILIISHFARIKQVYIPRNCPPLQLWKTWHDTIFSFNLMPMSLFLKVSHQDKWVIPKTIASCVSSILPILKPYDLILSLLKSSNDTSNFFSLNFFPS